MAKLYSKGVIILAKSILCYGDSNTWGCIPGTDKRFSRGERWTGILQNKLSDYYKPTNEFEIIEEGLAGRTMGSSSAREGRDGYTYLKPCLDSHNPLYSVILMLGVNELKKVNNKSPEEIGDMLEYRFVRPILEHLLLCGYLDEYESLDSYRKTHKLIIVCPPIVSEDNYNKCETSDKFLGATDKSKELIDIYRKISEKYYCGFIDSNGLETGCDGLHLDIYGHEKLAEILFKLIV